MTVYNKDNPLKVGDRIQIAGNEVTVTCSVTSALFPGELLVICSQETFERLTGEQGLTMVGVQLDGNAVYHCCVYDSLRGCGSIRSRQTDSRHGHNRNDQ